MIDEKDILNNGEFPEDWDDKNFDEKLEHYDNLEAKKRPIDQDLIEVGNGPVGEMISYLRSNGKKIKVGKNALLEEKDGIFRPVQSTHKPALVIDADSKEWKIVLNDLEQEDYAQELSQELVELFPECKSCTVERSE